jgi:hypothetical protein
MQTTPSEQDYEYVSYTIDTTGYNPDKVKAKTYVNPLNNHEYTILNNDSSYITFDDTELRNYRSIVLNATDDILCFSPPNAIPLDNFKEKYPDDAPSEGNFPENTSVRVPLDDVYANEIVEGTMINLFYDEHSQMWEIGSRGAIGGNYWYYRTQYVLESTDFEPTQTGWTEPRKISTKQQMTFRDMFIDAMKSDPGADLNTLPLLEYLPKNYCYSFVLQHPENHIVLPIQTPHLFLVAVYEIADKKTVKFVPPHVYETWPVFTNSVIEFPRRYDFATYKELEDTYASIHSDYSTMGVMLTNLKTGERASLSNPVYEDIKKLRGNNPNLQYQYFCLLRSGQVDKFLEYFPTYRKVFMQFGKQYQDFITSVHQSYFSYYVKKEGVPIAKKYFIHASKIHHQIFLPSLNTSGESTNEKVVITRKVVKKYFDDMTPSENLYYVNYDKRQVTKKNQPPETDIVVEDA